MFDLIFFSGSLITGAIKRPTTNWRKQYFQSPCKMKWSKLFVAQEHDFADTVEHLLCSSVQKYLQGFEPNLMPLSENLTNYSGKKNLCKFNTNVLNIWWNLNISMKEFLTMLMHERR